MLGLLRACKDPAEIKYLVRTLIQVSRGERVTMDEEMWRGGGGKEPAAGVATESMPVHAVPASQNLRVGANWRSISGPLAKAATLHRASQGIPPGLALSTAKQRAGAATSASASSLPQLPAPPGAAGGAAGKGAGKGKAGGGAGGRGKEKIAPEDVVVAEGVTKGQLDAAAAAAAAAYHTCPSWDLIVPALLDAGAEGLAER